MANGLELLERHVKRRNPALEAFLADADKIKRAIEKDRVRGRSPVKLEGETAYNFTLENREISINGKDEALQYLAELTREAYDENDSDFRGAIEEAYSQPGTEVKKQGRKKKAA
jgi:hypothetical protein